VKIESEAWRRTVIQGGRALGVEVSADQVRTLSGHAQELLRWNRVTNLTTITDPLEMAVKHYVDALAAAGWIGSSARILDAGSGGGFPGLPLKIVRPDLAVTLVDSVRKKVAFLNFVIGTLGLSGIHAVHDRLEELGRSPAYARKFDVVVCRAFASLEDFVALCLPLLAPGGSLLALKGPQADHDHEIGGVSGQGKVVLGGQSFTVHIHRYTLPVLGDRRRLVRLTPAIQGG
jgi:16S rRNA (guanine527-N7)-methyltransferase